MVPEHSTTDLHADVLESLETRDDWAGLLRYWMAHPDCDGALQRAAARLRRMAAEAPDAWQPIVDRVDRWAARRLVVGSAAADRVPPGVSVVERDTITLLPVYEAVLIGEQSPAAADLVIATEAALDWAIDLAERLEDRGLRARLLRSRCLPDIRSGGRREGAAARLRPAADAFRELASDFARCGETLAELLVALGRALHEREPIRAEETLDESIALLRRTGWSNEERRRVLLSDAAVERATLHARRGHFDPAISLYREAADLLTWLAERDDRFLSDLIIALTNAATAHLDLGAARSAAALYDEALDVLRPAAERDFPRFGPMLARMLALRVEAVQEFDDPELEASWLEELACTHERLIDLTGAESRRAAAIARSRLATNCLGRDEADRAARVQERAVEHARTLAAEASSGNAELLVDMLCRLALCRVALRREDDARRCWTEAGDLLGDDGNDAWVHQRMVVAGALGYLDLQDRNPEAAAAQLTAAVRLGDRVAEPSIDLRDQLANVAINLASAQQQLEQPDAARRTAERAVELARAVVEANRGDPHHRRTLAMALITSAEVASAPASALDLLVGAERVLLEGPAVSRHQAAEDSVRLLTTQARILVDLGEMLEAERAVLRAEAICERVAADVTLARATEGARRRLTLARGDLVGYVDALPDERIRAALEAVFDAIDPKAYARLSDLEAPPAENDLDPRVEAAHRRVMGRLIERGDWAALLRHWMTYGHDDALDAATTLVRASSGVERERRNELVHFLERIVEYPHAHPEGPPVALAAKFEGAERATIELAGRFPFTVVSPQRELSPTLLRSWLRHFRVARSLARAVDDPGLSANVAIDEAIAHQRLENLDAALVCARVAVEDLRPLAITQPDLVEAKLATALGVIGVCRSRAGDREQALAALEESAGIRRRRVQAGFDDQAVPLAISLHNLSGLHQEHDDLPAARRAIDEAVALYRRGGERSPGHSFRLAKSLDELGIVCRRQGWYDEAGAAYDESLEIYRDLDRDHDAHRIDAARTAYNLACLRRAQGRADDALARCGEAEAMLAGCQQRGVLAVRERVHRMVAELAPGGDAERSALEKSAEVDEFLTADDTGTRALEAARRLGRLGQSDVRAGDRSAARTRFADALEITRRCVAQRADDPDALVEVAAVLIELAGRQMEVHEVAGTRDACASAVSILQPLAATRIEHSAALLRDAMATLASSARQTGRLPEALAAQRETVRLFREAGAESASDLVYHLSVLAEMVFLDGRLDEAFALATEALEGDVERWRPRVLGTLVGIEMGRRRPEAALKWSDEQVETVRHLVTGDPACREELASAWSARSTVLSAFDDVEGALAAASESVEIREELAGEDPWRFEPVLARSLVNLGVAYRTLDRLSDAAAVFARAVEIRRRLLGTHPAVSRSDIANALYNLGTVQQDELEEAQRCLAECVTIYRDLYLGSDSIPQSLAAAIRKLAEIQIKRGDLTAAETSLLEAERLSARFRDRMSVSQLRELQSFYTLLATLYRTTSEPHGWPDLIKARATLRKARGCLEDYRSSFFAPDQRDEIQRDAVQLYEQSALVCYLVLYEHRDGGALEEMLEIGEAARARRLMDLLDDSAAETHADAPAIDFAAAAALLPADVPTAIVHVTVTHAAAWALVISDEHVTPVLLPGVTDGWLGRLAEAWRRRRDHFARCSPVEWDRRVRRVLRLLSDRVVRPLERELASRSVGRLIIVPNRALHVLPLHACRLSNGRYLADAYECVYAPSLGVLRHCVESPRDDPEKPLVVQDPGGDLVSVAAECAGVKRSFPAARVLAGPDTLKARVLAEAPASDVLHYAGHVTFQPADPLESALDMGGGDRLTLREVFADLRLPCNSLTVLSGCESGVLRPGQVDEYVGLPSGLLHAGARCVISTLWAIWDLPSALVMDRFYAEWRGGASIAGALREAQRWLREDIVSGECLLRDVLPGLVRDVESAEARRLCEDQARHYARRSPATPPFESPIYWSPFVAIGAAFPLAADE